MNTRATKPSVEVLTIGHSTRPIEAFIELLQAYVVKRLVDVRTVPRSRRNPHFNKEVLPAALLVARINYTHLPGLGGLRHARRDSPNTGWRNSSFRGFADYMQTEEFESALEEVIELAAGEPLALMCAEAVPWRCHRSLIADALLVRGVNVSHIMTRQSCRKHTLTPWAMVNGKQITYPAATLDMNLGSGRSVDAR
jgi:uncharacterized protein (DUF488 family)